MPLSTGSILGITSPIVYITREQNEKIAAQKQNELESRGGLGDVSNISKYAQETGYSSNRGILCEKEFSDVPERTLLFQFNPETIADAKSNNYEEKSSTGFTHIDYPWISGGSRVLTFELNFEATAGVNTPYFGKGRNTSTSYGVPTIETLDQHFPRGTMDDIDILRGFMYPRLLDSRTPRFVSNGGAHIPTPKFMPPPVLIFAYGTEIYLEGILADCNIEHTAWDAKLIPRRSRATVTFKVFESYVPTKDVLVTDKRTIRLAQNQPPKSTAKYLG